MQNAPGGSGQGGSGPQGWPQGSQPYPSPAGPQSFQNPGQPVPSTGQPPQAYGQPAAPPQAYGQPATPPQAYGQPATPPQAYGQPAAPPQAYGQPAAPPQAYGQPTGDPSGGADISALVGFPLQPGERVLHFVRRSYTGEKIQAWILGVLFSVFLFGLYFIYVALTVESKSPRGFALTNRRFVVINPTGDPTSYWFEHYADLEPKRGETNVRGGGLIGALVVAAVEVGLDALADRKKKEDPGYWTRTVAIILKRRDGGTQVIPVRPAEGQSFGPLLAKTILGGMGDQLPAMDVRRLQAMPATPSKPGIPALVLGILLFFVGFLPLIFGADGVGCSGFSNPFKGVGLLIGLVLTGGGLLLCFFGARKMSAPRPGAPPPKSKFHPLLLLPAGLFVFGYGIAGCWGVKEAIRCNRSSDNPYEKKARPTATSESTTSTVDYSSVSPMTGDRVRKVLLSLDYPGGSITSQTGDWFGAPELYWQAKGSTGTAIVYLWDFSADKPPKYFGLGSQQVVSLELSGATDGGKEAQSIATALAAKTLSDNRDITAVTQPLGYRGDKAYSPSNSKGRRTLFHMAKKGTNVLSVNVMDLSAAAANRDNSAVLIKDKKIVFATIISGTGDAASIVQKVGGR